MIDQYFGIKELYKVALKAKTDLMIGSRRFEKDETVLYFEKVSLAMLNEQSRAIMARGGQGNMPRVIQEDRSEVTFSMQEGVLSSMSFGILLSAKVTTSHASEPLYVSKREGPLELDEDSRCFPEYQPLPAEEKKTFIYEWRRDVAQRKLYGKRVHGLVDPLDESKERPCLQLYDDKALMKLADPEKKYIIDYYYKYDDEALIYSIEKERFNGLFSLEGEFYSKDENEGLNYTNILYMPRVRIVSSINLRLGERADPTVGSFNIIGMPENIGVDRKNLIVEIIRLNSDLQNEI